MNHKQRNKKITYSENGLGSEQAVLKGRNKNDWKLSQKMFTVPSI